MKNKGFTLIELLAVIILLGVILTIAIVNFTDILDSSSDKIYKQTEDVMESAAYSMLITCYDVIGVRPSYCSSIMNKASVNVTVETLINNNFLTQIEDPEKKGAYCSDASYVTITTENTSNIKSAKFKAHLICSKYSS